MIRVFIHFSVFGFLTLLTQIGGIAYLIALFSADSSKGGRATKIVIMIFMLILTYGAGWFGAHLAAPLFGRYPIACSISGAGKLVSQSPVYCALNRHYVSEDLKDIAEQLSIYMDDLYPGTLTLVLDGSFPFFDGFPLLPHLSHNDGNKMDFAFFYGSNGNDYTAGATRSPIGYWAFEQPDKFDATPCSGRHDLLTMRWDMLWFERFNGDETLNIERTASAVQWLISEGQKKGVSKIFIEPHLASRLNVESGLIRFQGCRAARHDDHLHIQIN